MEAHLRNGRKKKIVYIVIAVFTDIQLLSNTDKKHACSVHIGKIH